MKILLIGSGGREHALAWKISRSKHCEQLFIAPGNPGTGECGKNISIATTDFKALADFIFQEKIELVIVGPEEPLVKGLVDFFRSDERVKHVGIVGPSKAGAQLEGSKDFSKLFMKRHGIPTAAYETFTRATFHEGVAFLKKLKPPYVLKADGLAAGKGVVIPHDLETAEKQLKEMLLDSRFGSASDKVVIEEFLPGIEISVFVLTDGNGYKILPSAKDYKRIGDGDTGPNTGGMGAVSPVPFADKVFMDKVEQQIIIPTVEGLKKDKIDYRGFIFIGLMNVNGEPFVIEYNVRMGDPETEVVMPRIKSDVVELFSACANRTLSTQELLVDERTALTVMLVSGGYPGDYEKGKAITIEPINNAMIFHAGTSKNAAGKLVTAGGRVIAVTSLSDSILEAAKKAYDQAAGVSYAGKFNRSDIGNDLI